MKWNMKTLFSNWAKCSSITALNRLPPRKPFHSELVFDQKLTQVPWMVIFDDTYWSFAGLRFFYIDFLPGK